MGEGERWAGGGAWWVTASNLMTWGKAMYKVATGGLDHTTKQWRHKLVVLMPLMNYTGFELAGVYFTGPEIWHSGNTDLAIYSHFVCVKGASQMWLYYPEFQLLCRYTYTAANQFSQAQSQLISQLHGLTCRIFQ